MDSLRHASRNALYEDKYRHLSSSDWKPDPTLMCIMVRCFKMATSLTPFLMPNHFQRPTLLPLSRQLRSFTRLFTSTAISRHEDSTKHYRPEYNWIRGVETLERYEPGVFHPVTIGNVLHGQYCIVDKLGFGGYSMVWLAWDVHQKEYAAVKVLQTQPQRLPGR